VTAAPGPPLASLRFVSAPTEISTGLRVLPPVGQRIVPIFEHIASAAGKPLRPGARVLDFGAGAGRHVAEFREAGYDALGVDQQYLSHAEGSVEHEFLRRVEPPDYVLPFADGEFDLVYSTSVMEHVLDPGVALTQIARVLQPGGISIHHFPSRWRPVEPHMLVPFGGRFQSFALMRLWARLGLRNSFQRGAPATEVALMNTQYCKTGINYPTATEWRLRAEPLFARVEWAEREYVEASRGVSSVSRLVAPVVALPGVEAAYRALHTRVLVLHRD
jgi:SAM-dependent methyltransferase